MGILRQYHAPVVAILLGWLLSAGNVLGQASREYDVKAVFLYNFASFVEWPEAAFTNPDAPFVIGVLGNDPFGRALEDVIKGERGKNRPLQIKRMTGTDDVSGCHILFICASEAPKLVQILQRCRGKPVLTVADIPGFAETGGGMIGFRTEASRLRLEINLAQLRGSQLTVSSKLLRVARVIGEPNS